MRQPTTCLHNSTEDVEATALVWAGVCWQSTDKIASTCLVRVCTPYLLHWPCEANEARVELLDVTLHLAHIVTLRVNGNEDRLHLFLGRLFCSNPCGSAALPGPSPPICAECQVKPIT